MSISHCLFQAIDGTDVGMIQLGKELGFPFKPGQPLWVLGELLRQHLDGDFTAQVGIFGSVRLYHSKGNLLLYKLTKKV